jgi:hypothetical protein
MRRSFQQFLLLAVVAFVSVQVFLLRRYGIQYVTLDGVVDEIRNVTTPPTTTTAATPSANSSSAVSAVLKNLSDATAVKNASTSSLRLRDTPQESLGSKNDTQSASSKITTANDTHNTIIIQNNNEEERTPSTRRMYSVARYDRSGSVVHDMLRAHAYAFSQNQTYSGACVCCRKQRRAVKQRPTTKALLEGLGLTSALNYECPEPGNEHLIVNANVYAHNKMELVSPWSRKWQQNILSQLNVSVPQTTKQQNNETEILTIAVHIRRGDVEPCRFPARYLPNSHYLRLIQEYTPPTSSSSKHQRVQVSIYSESNSLEPFDDFVARNYSVWLDTDLPTVWRGIMTADVVILSKSSFSFVPALLNPTGTIVYTPNGENPPIHWSLVPENLLKQSTEDLLHIARKWCWESSGNDTNPTNSSLKRKKKRWKNKS